MRPPSEGEDNALEKFSVKPSLPDGDEPPPSKKKKNKDVPAQENFKVKGRREDPLQASSFFSENKRSKKRQRKSGIDLEELLAQTYPKEISAPVESAKKTPAGGSSRRSKSKDKRPPKRVSDSAKKWYDEEEISLSMALLECRRLPYRGINMAAFYQRAKESLDDEVSDIQLYDKMRSMKKKFKAIHAKLKEHNVAEDEFRYKTNHESALFRIWKRIWGNNFDNHGNHFKKFEVNDVQDLSEFENARENVVETPKEIENENPRGNGGQITNENFMEIEGENPGDCDAETPRERGAENPIVNDNERGNSGKTEGENPRGIEGENSGDIESESHIKSEVTKPRKGRSKRKGSGVEKEKGGEEQNLQNSASHEKEGEEQNLENSVSHEAQNIEDNRVCKLGQIKSGRFEDNIKIFLEKTDSRLASIESSINRVAVASAAGANFQPFGGLGTEMGMEVFLSRRMKELMDGINSVKGLPGLDSVEVQELQQKRYALKIQEMRVFCESLDLLQKQCRLFLKNAESSCSNNHGS